MEAAVGWGSDPRGVSMHRRLLDLVSFVVLSTCLIACGGAAKEDPEPEGPPADYEITVAPKSGGHPYAGVGSNQALEVNTIQGLQIPLLRGTTYRFLVNTPGHPFYFTTDPAGGLGWPGRITNGVVGDLTTEGVVEITPTLGHPPEFYYHSAADLNMGWKVVLTDPP